MKEFYYSQRRNMEKWRKLHISTDVCGTQNHPPKQNEKTFTHIVPYEYWTETLWKDVRLNLLNYIDNPNGKIESHDGVHNLLSSWVLCANTYFLIKINSNLKSLFADFLKNKVSKAISEIIDVELEFAFPDHDDLHPKQLLGEPSGTRGKKQTSPDVAFKVKTEDGKDGIILTEVKYTEYHFYGCSTNPKTAKDKSRGLNPDFSRCMHRAKSYDYKAICHQKTNWKRKYMDLVSFSENAEHTLQCCPAASDGYQLFRQQSLAEGIAKSGRFDLVVSSVAFDARNTDLIHCMKTTGINDFQTDWAPLFEGKAIFKTWTHQEWVQFVRDNQKNGEFNEWLEYLRERYGY